MKRLVDFYEIFFDIFIIFSEQFVLNNGNIEYKNIRENAKTNNLLVQFKFVFVIFQ